MSEIKQRRAAEQIQMLLSELIRREMRDPRVQGVTVVDVRVDREIQFAEVYVSALGDEAREDEVMAALERGAGFLRRALGRRLRLRSVPQLRFHWDRLLTEAERMNQLLDSLAIGEGEEE